MDTQPEQQQEKQQEDRSQQCKGCQQVFDLDNFYTYKSALGLPRHFSKCKQCHNGYKKKLTGFAKLPQDQQDRIKLLVADRRNKLTQIATEENISVQNLRNWVKKGL